MVFKAIDSTFLAGNKLTILAFTEPAFVLSRYKMLMLSLIFECRQISSGF